MEKHECDDCDDCNDCEPGNQYDAIEISMADEDIEELIENLKKLKVERTRLSVPIDETLEIIIHHQDDPELEVEEEEENEEEI